MFVHLFTQAFVMHQALKILQCLRFVGSLTSRAYNLMGITDTKAISQLVTIVIRNVGAYNEEGLPMPGDQRRTLLRK